MDALARVKTELLPSCPENSQGVAMEIASLSETEHKPDVPRRTDQLPCCIGNSCRFGTGARSSPYKNGGSSTSLQKTADPLLGADPLRVRSGSAAALLLKSGVAATSPRAFDSPEFQSASGTPNSITQLLASFSALDGSGLELPSPLGSGFLSPLNSAKLGRKRALSISPLSTGSLDLSNIIRSSPTSLLNYITASRGSSAGSIGHLSPSIFATQAPPQRQLLLKQQGSTAPAEDGPVTLQMEPDALSSRMKLEPAAMEERVRIVDKDAIKVLETVREEENGAAEENDENVMEFQQPEADVSGPAEQAGGNPKARKRIYYTYPNMEIPHNNQCRWVGCSVQCSSLDDLVRHVNMDHIYGDSKKDFVCCWEGCVREQRPFKAQYMLLVHMRRHTGEKPHQCTYEGCSKAYSRLENLKTHLRSHTGEKPYICKHKGCEKSFSNASDCAKHMNRTHSDEKPYACPNPGCCKRYTDPSSRRKHLKNCQVNKKIRTEDAMSGADEESCTEGGGVPNNKTRQAGQAKKAEKSSKKKKADAACGGFGDQQEGRTPAADHGYETGGSHGYASSQTGYTSSGYDTEYPSLRDDEGLSMAHRRLPSENHINSPGGHYLPPTTVRLITNALPNDKSVRQKRAAPPRMQMRTTAQIPPSYGSRVSPSAYAPYLATGDQSTVYPPNNDRSSECIVQLYNTAPMNNNHATALINVQRQFGADMASSGYSSARSSSPAKSEQKAACDERMFSSGGNGGFGLRNPLMTNSRSTFSSTSSRTSTPSSNNGRAEIKPLPSLFEDQPVPTKSPPLLPHPWRQLVEGQYGRHGERMERSWQSHSSHSSRYSVTGSELSDELLESLPTAGANRVGFSKAPPLPLPFSMQLLGQVGSGRAPAGTCRTDCGPLDEVSVHGPLGEGQQIHQKMAPAYAVNGADATFPLRHFGHESSPYDILSDAGPLTQVHTDGFLTGTLLGESPVNMAIGDMASFATALSSESQHYWDCMIQPAD